MPAETALKVIHSLPELLGESAAVRAKAHDDCRQLLDSLQLADRARLSRQLEKILLPQKQTTIAPAQHQAERLRAQLLASLALTEQRAALVPQINYPPELPITAALDRLREALAKSQVVVVAGETGSGKTTQLPKLCLEMGRGVFGRIGHTQPRRLAARTVAARLAEELGSPLGELVGYQHRFAENLAAYSRVLVMTDGSLLAQLHSDRNLAQFDTLIIDEAHERSLNIDFLLGVLNRLLPRRPELKVIITSATIDVQRFARFFDNAPCISVEGRGFPVEMRYLPELNASDIRSEHDDSQADINHNLILALQHIQRGGDASLQARDVLVFLPGEREIRDASLSLRHGNLQLEVLPLYARLPIAEQQRIFNPGPIGAASAARRRVVLATNVAETSLTVPGIGYVIDAGLARISRFSPRSKLQRLQTEPVSQASAAQRAGRAGRLAPGLCIRLYSREDFEARAAYTDPEIMRTQLASVILQTRRLGLGDLADFPLLERPSEAQLKAGTNTLQELGALAADGKLSAVGKQLASMPLDPQLGRMLLAASRGGCAEAVLVIVSAMAVQDPREVPADKRQAARDMHRRFAQGHSDFLDWLLLWDYYASLRAALSQGKMRKRLQSEFLSPSRMREWRDMHRQLRLALQGVGVRVAVRDVAYDPQANVAADAKEYETIHRALLKGIPLQVGLREQPDNSKQPARDARRNNKRAGSDYAGPRGLRFALWPGSALAKKKPRWVLAAEIVETSRVFARHVARIEPAWVAAELSHLTRFEYGEPRWHLRRGRVVASRRTLLFGLTLLEQKNFPYDKVDEQRAREIFIQSALVEQQLAPDAKLLAVATFWRNNLELLANVVEVEDKLRRRDLQISDQALFEFYASRLPPNVFDRVSLLRWLQKNGDDQQSLRLARGDVFARQLPLDALEQFPSQIDSGGQSYALRYAFAPGADNDGVTVRIPKATVPRMPLPALEWLVPGMLVDKVEELLKILPKAQRKKLLPLAETAASLSQRMVRDFGVGGCSLYDALLAKAAAIYGVDYDAASWRALARERLSPFYLMRAEVVDTDGAIVDSDRALAALQQRCMRKIDGEARAVSREQGPRLVSRWDFGALGSASALQGDTKTQGASAAQVDSAAQRCLRENQQGDLELQFCASVDEALMHSQLALPKLAMLALPDKVRYLRKQLCRDTLQLLPYVKVGDRSELVDDVIKAAIAYCCFDNFEQGLPANSDAFEQALQAGSGQIIDVAQKLEQALYELLQYYQQVCELLGNKRSLFTVQCDDVEAQLAELVYPGFLQRTGVVRFGDLARYLQAAAMRLDRLGGRDAKDRELCEKLSTLQRPLHDLLYKYPHALFCDPHVRAFRWLLEELRVSLFAQQLKTSVPVSIQRVSKAWQAVDLNHYPLLH